jgi:hypothetical protein
MTIRALGIGAAAALVFIAGQAAAGNSAYKSDCQSKIVNGKMQIYCSNDTQAGRYRSNCKSSYENGSTRIDCDDNLDSLLSTGTRSRPKNEEVIYTRPAQPTTVSPNTTKPAAPTQYGVNFCGPGFRYTNATGCVSQ